MILVEQELLRARWRRTLAEFGLDRTSRDDFGMGVLAGRLQTVTVQLMLLPADPEADVIDFDEKFASWLGDQRRFDLDGLLLDLPPNVRRTAHAVALTDGYGEDPWGSYYGVHRSGALEFGLGQSAGWRNRDGNDVETGVIALTPTVARTWVLLRFAATLAQRVPLEGPFSLAVAVPRAGGMLLGCLGEGWAPPNSFENTVRPCRDERLLWHIELPALPVGDDAKTLAYAVGDRLEDAWGCGQRRYLALRGQNQGKLDPRQV